MKFIHLIPVLAGAAAVAALRPAIAPAFGLGESAEAGAGTARPSVTPPWLTGEWQAEASAELARDPHADVCSGLPVTAEDGSDPHAALCANTGGAGDPHAALHGAGADYTAAHGASDPHLGQHEHAGHDHDHDHAAHGPASGGLHGGDPHAGVHEDPHGADVRYEAASIAPPAAPVEASKAPNGKRVADVFAERTSLAQKTIAVRGVVVKLMEGILGQTYLHLQDGSGSAEAGNNDLTVTTSEPFTLGETVEVQGLLAIDRDVGAGYSYPALLTGAVRIAR